MPLRLTGSPIGPQLELVLVARPRNSALAEAARTARELANIGISNQQLAINGVMPAVDSGDPLADALRRRDRGAIGRVAADIAALPRAIFPLQPMNLVGIAALRCFAMGNTEGGDGRVRRGKGASEKYPLPSLGTLIDALEGSGKGLIMLMGKGGVGKTTMAAAIAAELAGRGHDVHLTTTDPAAHLTETLNGELERLTVSRIDPALETRRYRDHVLVTKGKDLDAGARALLEEDLRSPCTEEIAVFQAFSRVIRESSHRFVVMDTAPTGHTLLLLDATGAYHRDVLRHSRESATRLVTPMMRLQDPEQTENPYRHFAGDDAGPRSGEASERSEARRHRAVGLDRQCRASLLRRPTTRSWFSGLRTKPERSAGCGPGWPGASPSCRCWPRSRSEPNICAPLRGRPLLMT